MRRLTLGLMVAAVAHASCARWVLKGARPRERVPAPESARWSLAECRTADSGTTVKGPDAEYVLEKRDGSSRLFEVQPGAKSGTAYDNKWSDDAGTYFFAWQIGGAGYLFVLPADATVPAERRVFTAGTYAVAQPSAGHFEPSGSPAVRCALQRRGPRSAAAVASP